MSDQDWLKRFGVDVDNLFKTGMVADPAERTPAEYSQVLALARTLTATDFSDQSQIQSALRRRLLTRMDAREGWHPKERAPMFPLFRARRFPMVLATVILGGLLIAGLTWSGALTAVAQSAIDFVQRTWIGEHTSIEPVDEQVFPPPCRVVISDGDFPTMQSMPVEPCEAVEKNAECGEGEIAATRGRRFDSIAEAQAVMSFPLRQPGYLPEGYTFSVAKVWSSGDWVFADLYFDGPRGRVLLSQRPVGGQSEQKVSIGLPRVSVVETVQVNGQSATWAEGTLLWEAGDISYFLISDDLSLAEAIRIAESLE